MDTRLQVLRSRRRQTAHKAARLRLRKAGIVEDIARPRMERSSDSQGDGVRPIHYLPRQAVSREQSQVYQGIQGEISRVGTEMRRLLKIKHYETVQS